MTEPRTYRVGMGEGRYSRFIVRSGESDLWVGVEPRVYSRSLARETLAFVAEKRNEILGYARSRPVFLTSFEPLKPVGSEPYIVSKMIESSAVAGVGPMASVAGAISDEVLAFVREKTGALDIAVENGGDDCILASKSVVVSIGAGYDPDREISGIELPAGGPYGIASSSGKIGHSFSYGKADVCVIVSESSSLADAWATSIGNIVSSQADVGYAVRKASGSMGVKGVCIVCDGVFGASGNIRIVSVSRGKTPPASAARRTA